MIGRHKMALFKWKGANINVVLIHACHCETKDGCAQALEEASKMAPDATTIIAWQTKSIILEIQRLSNTLLLYRLWRFLGDGIFAMTRPI